MRLGFRRDRRRRAGVRGAAIRNSGARRPRAIRRSTPRLSPIRAAAALVMLCSVVGMYGLTATSTFAVRSVGLAFDGTPLTTEDSVRAVLGLTTATPNVFLVATDRLAARLRDMPAVESASVVAGLPGRLDVRLVEREPILTWLTPGHRFLVDRDGLIIADAGAADDPAADPTLASVAAGLPAVDDRRAESASLAVGASLDPVDLDVATRLGSLTAADVGSAASGISITVSDDDGYTIGPRAAPPAGSSGGGTPSSSTPAWTAVFGFYTPTIRTADLIPGEVRVLRSLLLGRETKVARIIVADGRGGTYTLR